MPNTVIHNRCQHCGADFTRGCVVSYTCPKCVREGHVDDFASRCPKCEERDRAELARRQDQLETMGGS